MYVLGICWVAILEVTYDVPRMQNPPSRIINSVSFLAQIWKELKTVKEGKSNRLKLA